KHLKKAGLEVEVMQCNPHQDICFPNMQNEIQTIAARKQLLEAKADSPEIQNTKINITPVTLHYLPKNTTPQIASDYKTVTSVTLGSFDASPLNSVLDQVIPSITVTVDATKLNNELETLVVERGGKMMLNGSDLSIQLRCDKFDVELRKSLGFDKVRFK